MRRCAGHWKLRRRVGRHFRSPGEISAAGWSWPARIGTMIARDSVAASLQSMLFITIARFGLRLSSRALRRGVRGQSLESVVGLGNRLIGLDLFSPIGLFAFAVVGLLASNRFR